MSRGDDQQEKTVEVSHAERVAAARLELLSAAERMADDGAGLLEAERYDNAVDALIAAVRADQLDRVETVINVMPHWGNGYYIDVEHFRGKLSHTL